VMPRTGQPRGTPARDRPAWQFVYVIQNHDQVGNRPFGDRLHHQLDRGRYKAATMVLLFLPQTPLLFMGQEFAASSPFQYFTDHAPELGKLVTAGRRKEFAAFSSFTAQVPDPQDEATFVRSKLPLDEAANMSGDVQQLYADLLRLRRDDPVLAGQDRWSMTAAAVGPDVLVVRRWLGDAQRMLIANFGARVERVDWLGAQLVLASAAAPHIDGGVVAVAPRSAVILKRG
jgi:maltooligosyltrehalose trehalohydrolase